MSTKKKSPLAATKAPTKKVNGPRAETLIQTRDLRVIALEDIQRDPDQPRRHWDRSPAGVADITSTLKIENGIAEPIHPPQVRASPKGAALDVPWTTLVGERRTYAAEVAGATHLRVEVVDILPGEVRAYQLAENVGRDALAPLDLADAVHRLVAVEKRSAEDVAARIGSSPGLIRKLVAVAGICDEGRAAYDRGCDLRVCCTLALIKDKATQSKAARDVFGDGAETAPMTAISALAFLRNNYLLRLATAPFNVKDESLPGGPCARCPKNTEAQKMLFDGASDEARCTDASCWKNKVRITDERAAEAALKASKSDGPAPTAPAPAAGKDKTKPAAKSDDTPASERKPAEFSAEATKLGRKILNDLSEARARFSVEDWSLLRIEVSEETERRPVPVTTQ